MRRLKFAEIEERRNHPGQAALLFLTDRCPVGCLHCSVDSRPDSPRVQDLALLEELVTGLCRTPGITTVGISGGEPFTERSALELAVGRLRACDIHVVLYTSGYWAARRIPGWVPAVLADASCVFLSTDAYHRAMVTEEAWVRAARLIAAQDTWIVVQVVDQGEALRESARLASLAFGDGWGDRMEIHPIPLLPVGRAAAWALPTGHARPGRDFAECGALGAPVIRYDGSTSACCNERVIMGQGPGRLRPRCASADDVVVLMGALREDPLLGVMRHQAVGALTEHPTFADLADRRFKDMCELCWAIQERAGSIGEPADPLLHLMGMISAFHRDSGGSVVMTKPRLESS